MVVIVAHLLLDDGGLSQPDAGTVLVPFPDRLHADTVQAPRISLADEGGKRRCSVAALRTVPVLHEVARGSILIVDVGLVRVARCPPVVSGDLASL